MIMKNMNILRLSVLVSLAILLIGNAVFAEARGDVALKIRGTRITVNDFLRQVSPELLPRIPKEVLNTYVIWGESPAVQYGNNEIDDSSDATRSVISVWRSWTFYVAGKRVTYGGSNTIVIPPMFEVPAMSVYCFLMEDGTSIDTHGDYDTNVWRVTSQESRTVNGGAWYYNMIYHMTDYPAGYNPPVEFHVNFSNMRWIPE
jgi:hypothetical protein